MKNLLITSCLAVLVIAMAGCGGNGTTEKKLESKGYFGKLAAIKAAYKADDSTMVAKAKTEAKSADDLVAFQSKINKLEEDAKAEFKAETAKMKFPITLPFVDSAGSTAYVVKDAKITAVDWDRATIEATIEVKTDSEKTMGGQNVQFTVPALMLDENGKVIKDHSYDAWLILAVSKEMKAGETHTVSGVVSVNAANAALNKLIFKSYDDYKKAKGWN